MRLRTNIQLALLAVLLTALMISAHAENSAGFDVSGGVGTSGFDLSGALDLKLDPAQKPWEASLNFAHLHSKVGTESRSNQVVFGLAHTVNDNWDGHGNLSYWRDNLNKVDYVGPTFGFTYTWLEGPAPRPPEQPGEFAAVTLDTDLFVYGTDVVSTGVIRTVRDPVTHQLVNKKIGAGTAAVHMVQLHPNLTAEKPLWDETITPYVTVGHYFYSRDPALFESIAGRPRFAASAARLNSLVGGLLNNNASVGLRIELPIDDAQLSPSFGVEQSATDLTWATVQEIALTFKVVKSVRTKMDWSRAIQDGNSSDVLTGGLAYVF